jgi:hypothetical protein
MGDKEHASLDDLLNSNPSLLRLRCVGGPLHGLDAACNETRVLWCFEGPEGRVTPTLVHADDPPPKRKQFLFGAYRVAAAESGERYLQWHDIDRRPKDQRRPDVPQKIAVRYDGGPLDNKAGVAIEGVTVWVFQRPSPAAGVRSLDFIPAPERPDWPGYFGKYGPARKNDTCRWTPLEDVS